MPLDFRIRHAHRLSRWFNHRPVQYLLDAACTAWAVWLACVLRFEGQPTPYLTHSILIWAAILALLTPSAFSAVGGYRSTWRHFGMIDLVRLSGAIALIECVLIALRLTVPGKVMGYSIAILWGANTLALCSLLRMMRMLDHKAVLSCAGDRANLDCGYG